MNKTIFISFLSLIVFSFLISSAEEVEKPTINVIYPLPGSEVKVQEGKTFLFGQVQPPKSKLFINGEQIKLDEDGAFIHYTNVIKMNETKSLQVNDTTVVPVNGYFELKAEVNGIEERFNYYVKIIDELKTSPSDILQFDDSYEVSPSSNLRLQPGETFIVSVKGTPNCQAYFTIDGIKEKFPLVEIYKCNEFFLSEAIFGSGFRLSKDTIKGIYEGHLILPQLGSEFRNVTVHLVHPKLGEIKKILNGKISTYNSNQYDVVEIIDEPNRVIARTGPGLGYKMFLPGGVKAIADGEDGDWIRLRIADNEIVYVPNYSVKYLPKGTPPPMGKIQVIRTKDDSNFVRVEIGLNEKVPFQVIQNRNPQRLTLKLFGVTSDIDWIFYDKSQGLINEITWNQLKKDVLEIEINLKQKQQWGYYYFYEGNILVLRIKKSPIISNKFLLWGSSLKGRKISIDPGHNPEYGAIGPRNIKEKDVNLSISLKLKQMLEEKGAYVSLTHTNDPLPLRSRKQRVLISEPDVSISIHNNAVPDGVNPIVHNGTSVYFYNPNAQLLATKLHKHLLKDLKLPNFGLYWDNLYMCRIPETIAVLVEPAFMSLPEQEKLLINPAFQEKIAKSLCAALEEFFNEVRE